MRAIFVLFYLPVLFSTTHAPKLLPLVKGDATASAEATFCEDRVFRQCLTLSCPCPALHTPVEPVNGEKALILGWNILATHPYGCQVERLSVCLWLKSRHFTAAKPTTSKPEPPWVRDCHPSCLILPPNSKCTSFCICGNTFSDLGCSHAEFCMVCLLVFCEAN